MDDITKLSKILKMPVELYGLVDYENKRYDEIKVYVKLRKRFEGKEDNGKLHSRKHNFYNIVKYDEWLNLRKK